jgi:hypothetical protein
MWGKFCLKKLTYAVFALTLFVVFTIVFSPLSNSTSNNPCGGCIHSGYYQYLNVVVGAANNQIPINLGVNQTATVAITIQNDVPDYPRYTTISSVYVTLTSVFGHFAGGSSIFVGDFPPGTQTVSWQITATSEGYDYLQIKTDGFNSHRGVSFQDSYSPLVTIGQPTGPIPTPPSTPTPPPTPIPNPSSTSIITPRPSPTSTLQPSSTPNPSGQPEQLQIQLISPTQNEKWIPQTNQTIEWTTSGGKEPLNVTLEYSFSAHNGAWATIATNLPVKGSLDWITPSSSENYYVNASVGDTSSPVQTSSDIAQVINQAASSPPPILPIGAAILATIIVLVAIVLFKRRKAGKTSI